MRLQDEVIKTRISLRGHKQLQTKYQVLKEKNKTNTPCIPTRFFQIYLLYAYSKIQIYESTS